MALSEIESYDNSFPIVSRNIIVPFMLLTSCFALWGLAHNMTDVLVAQFRKTFSLSDLESSLVQAAFYGAYFFLALPAALFIQKYNYKTGVLLGLGLFACGALLFYPASRTMEYSHFLTALFVLAGGLSILETSANPYIYSMGAPQTAIQRLNLAQAFNPIGCITGVAVGKFFILTGLHPATEAERSLMDVEHKIAIQAGELQAAMAPYLTVAGVIVLVWFVIAFMPMPASRRHDRPATHWKSAFARLLGNVVYRRGVLAQFMGVGCQVCCWSYTIRYVMAQVGGDEADASSYLLCSIILFALGRFLFTWLMSFMAPDKMLAFLCAVSVVLCFVVMIVGGWIGVGALVLVSCFMSITFPTIFGLSLGTVSDEDTSLGGCGLIMAILGGAVLVALMGAVSDVSTISTAYIVPLSGFGYITFFACFVSQRGGGHHGPAA